MIFAVLSKTEDGFTSSELAVRFKMSQAWARQKIRELVSSQQVECIGAKEITRVDGRKSQAPVYKIVKGD